MGEEEQVEGRSLFETPTWAVATVITVMVVVGILVNTALDKIREWLFSTKRKALLSALEKIKQELMIFGLLSLLMGHWTIWVSKICIKASEMNSRFYPCSLKSYDRGVSVPQKTLFITNFQSLNHSVFVKKEESPPHKNVLHEFCPEGHEPFASYESLEQLHRLLFVLGIIHVSYSFATIVLAMLKIYSWRAWENQAELMADQGLQGLARVGTRNIKRLSTFVDHHTSHPWSQNRVLIWMLCFSRQFWSSINKTDYMALRLGFITTHNLHLSYDFHSYMLRSMDDEFRDIVGISVPLWAYAIFAIFIDFHGTDAYFWLSFAPAFLILLVGTKLHHIVLKLALEVTDADPYTGAHFNLRDELFWFGRPKILLWLIQLISFQNAFEMATFIWSLENDFLFQAFVIPTEYVTIGCTPQPSGKLCTKEHPIATHSGSRTAGHEKSGTWRKTIVSHDRDPKTIIQFIPCWEIETPSCFMDNQAFLVVRLASGLIFQFWCSFITFPLYVIITQMGSKFKKSVVSENIRESLQEWHRRAKKLKRDRPSTTLSTRLSTTSPIPMYEVENEMAKMNNAPSSSSNSYKVQKIRRSSLDIPPSNEDISASRNPSPLYGRYDDYNGNKNDRLPL